MAVIQSARHLASRKQKEGTPVPGGVQKGEGGDDSLGEKLRRIRADLGLTLQEVGARSTVARSTISKIENGQLSPTFDLLQRLARGLGIDLAELFSNKPATLPNGRRSITRARMGHIIETKEYIYEALSTDLTRKQMFPLRTRIKARNFAEFGGWVRHEGEEFLFVLTGEICVYTEHYEATNLKCGDSIYIDSRMGHAVVSLGEDDADVLWVCTQVSLDF